MNSIYHVESGKPQDITFFDQVLSLGPNKQPEVIHRLSHYIVSSSENSFGILGADFAISMAFNYVFSEDGVDTRVWPLQEQALPDFLLAHIGVESGVIDSIAIQQAGSPETDAKRSDAVLVLLQGILQLRASFGIEDVIIKRPEQQVRQ